MRRDLQVLGAVAAGGALGASARAGMEQGWGQGAGTFPWTTLGINVAGSLLLGMLTVLTTVFAAAWWVRPLLGTGALGGFTTFSAYVVWAGELAVGDDMALAAGYLVATPVLCVAAAWLGAHCPAVLGLPHGHPPLARTQE
ncbi:MAG: CrcB family protein [Ornithinimicrobium sp.]